MTGCQSFQFVESPIPVKNAPIKNILVKNTEAMTITNDIHQRWNLYKTLIKKADIVWYLLFLINDCQQFTLNQ